jgi:uncharacterized protein with FMN-binding domain
MLNSEKSREGLVGKLLLSSALVAISLAYGWWQRSAQDRPVLVMAPMPPPLIPSQRKPVPPSPDGASPAPVQSATVDASDRPSPVTAAPQVPKSFAVANAAPQATPSSVAPAAAPAPLQQNVESSSSPLTSQQALQMNLPTDADSLALPLVTGSPEPGAVAQIPAGTHLEDGEYVSGKHELMWGDLKIRISIHGGQITGVQALQFPDHRSQSLYLSQMALPILESEVIKSQKYQVDTVSSATDTSYTFQDAIADAIVKATRG